MGRAYYHYTTTPLKFLSSSNCNSIFFETCSVEEIVDIINGFENGKASDIPILIIKKCCDLLCDHISKFINSFMEIGIFPDVLKRGLISQSSKKVTLGILTITDQFLLFQFLVKSMKNYCIIGYRVSSLLTILFTTSSLDSGETIPLVMQSTMQCIESCLKLKIEIML